MSDLCTGTEWVGTVVKRSQGYIYVIRCIKRVDPPEDTTAANLLRRLRYRAASVRMCAEQRVPSQLKLRRPGTQSAKLGRTRFRRPAAESGDLTLGRTELHFHFQFDTVLSTAHPRNLYRLAMSRQLNRFFTIYRICIVPIWIFSSKRTIRFISKNFWKLFFFKGIFIYVYGS